jgi:Protein of unknown function (DUF3592)
MVATASLLLVQYSTSHGSSSDGAARVQLLIFAIGALLVVRGSVPLVRARRWSAHACRATGFVVDHVRLGDRKHVVTTPIVEFDAGGANVRFVGVDDSRSPRPLGSSVPVLYDPADPGHARLADRKITPSWWLILGLIAVIAAVAAT